MEGLPTEILLHIFSLLNPPIRHFTSPWATERLRDLLSLSLVCRRFSPSATELLYECIERGGLRRIDTLDLALAMRQYPALAKRVKSIRYKAHSDNVWGTEFRSQGGDISDDSLCVLCSKSGMPLVSNGLA